MDTTPQSRRATRIALGLALAWGAIAASPARAPPTLPARAPASAEDIVVIAQRSGIPVWRVTGPASTAVLVGTIGRVTPGTRWDPLPLDAALAKADRVMFPETIGVSGGAFTIIGALAKWRSQASLPRGQTLQAMTTPAQWARLVALQNRGLLKPGFERKHPFHLALTLRGMVQDRGKLVPGADSYVRRFLGKNKAKRVPMRQASAKEVMREFFGSAPRTHVACLMDAVAQVEAGRAGTDLRRAAMEARSRAWAERRVADAVAAKPDDGLRSCWPSSTRLDIARDASLTPTIRSLLNAPQSTVVILSIDSLARPGGVLDDLVAAGFDVRGPRWKR